MGNPILVAVSIGLFADIIGFLFFTWCALKIVQNEYKINTENNNQ